MPFVACPVGKVPHWGEEDAEREARRMNERRNPGDEMRTEWQPYLCPKCKQWHIGRGWKVGK
jgi:hypothetical protein